MANPGLINQALHEEATKDGATYLDAEHDTMDGPSDEVLSTTTKRKAGMGQKGGRHSPIEGEWTHLVGEDTHA
jgi:hypothetical protein